MSATIPWSPVQLWKRHRGATIAGFLPPVLLLIVLTTQASNNPLSDVIGAILFCFAWGLVLAHVIAARRWLTASLAFVGLPVIALVGVFAFVDFAYAPEPTSAPPPQQTEVPTQPPRPAPTPPGPLDPSHPARPSPPDRAAPPRKAPLPAPPPTAVPTPNLDPFRQYSRQLVSGAVGFDYPPKMRVGDRTDVSLRVSVKKAVQELRESLTREGRNPIVEPAKLSSRMRAELRGFGFELMSLSSIEQLIDADEDTTWTWDVRATEPGKHRLTVILTAIIDLEQTEGVRDVSTFYRDVDVEALPKTWWQNTRDVVLAYGPSRDVLWPAIPTAIAAGWALLFARRKAKARKGRRSG
jgi:hypothetical protein